MSTLQPNGLVETPCRDLRAATGCSLCLLSPCRESAHRAKLLSKGGMIQPCVHDNQPDSTTSPNALTAFPSRTSAKQLRSARGGITKIVVPVLHKRAVHPYPDSRFRKIAQRWPRVNARDSCSPDFQLEGPRRPAAPPSMIATLQRELHQVEIPVGRQQRRDRLNGPSAC